MVEAAQHERLGDAVAGCLVGTAVGDALGLPCEGLSRRRQALLVSSLDRYSFLAGRGIVSDDTEHALMVAQALGRSGGDVVAFGRDLAWGLRRWIACVPAGTGFATLRACAKLWLGFSWRTSGVVSAGNGPAMRSPVIGVWCGDDVPMLRRLVRASTVVTHRDPKAYHGALAVARAAGLAASGAYVPTDVLRDALAEALVDEAADEFLALVDRVVASVSADESAETFADAIGCRDGVSGYVFATVPVVLHVWLRHQHDMDGALTEVIRLGGDTDSTAAIVGAIVGAGVGRQGIPACRVAGLWEWPRTVPWMDALATAVTAAAVERRPVPTPSSSVAVTLVRNVLFAAVVLAHGLRRWLPPY